MEIKNNKKGILYNSIIYLAIGIVSAICALFWLIQATFYSNINLLMIVISLATSIAGIKYGTRKSQQ